MLARGVLARLAADVPKTSTPDLSRPAYLLQRRLLTRNGLLAPSSAARSRACRAALLDYRRSYATTATEVTPKVIRDVKKAVAKKPVAKVAPEKPAKKTAAKKKTTPTKKTAAKKKTAVKKKKAAKPKPKPKRVKKELSSEDKAKLQIKEYKEKALKPPHQPTKMTAWQLFAAEALTQKGSGDGKDILLAAGAKYKNLTPAEREHYNHLANERTAAKRAEYVAWIQSHTPEAIRNANVARTWLRRKITTPVATRRRFFKLQDERLLKSPPVAYIRFSVERRASGDMNGIALTEASKLCGQEWKALSSSEKQKYQDEYLAELAEYDQKYEKVYGHPRHGSVTA